MSLFMVFDVESVGLHGPAFAVGWVVVDSDFVELENSVIWVDPSKVVLPARKPYPQTKKDLAWANENVLPSLQVFDQASNKIVLLERFGSTWNFWERRGLDRIYMCADVPWPVETNFLSDCFRYTHSKPSPYPLIDIASVRLASGLDPVADEKRQPCELPKHNPLADARQSARLLKEALSGRKTELRLGVQLCHT